MDTEAAESDELSQASLAYAVGGSAMVLVGFILLTVRNSNIAGCSSTFWESKPPDCVFFAAGRMLAAWTNLLEIVWFLVKDSANWR